MPLTYIKEVSSKQWSAPDWEALSSSKMQCFGDICVPSEIVLLMTVIGLFVFIQMTFSMLCCIIRAPFAVLFNCLSCFEEFAWCCCLPLLPLWCCVEIISRPFSSRGDEVNPYPNNNLYSSDVPPNYSYGSQHPSAPPPPAPIPAVY